MLHNREFWEHNLDPKIDVLRIFTDLFAAFHRKRCVSNPLTPNDHYGVRTAPLISKRCILYIYSTNIGTEYFKYGI